MVKTQEFIDQCDVLLNEEMMLYQTFRRCFEVFLEAQEYDSFVTMFALILNREISREMKIYKEEHSIHDLPKQLEKTEGIRLGEQVKEWQLTTREKLEKYKQRIISFVENYYNDKGTVAPTGMISCLQKIGHVLIYSAMMYDDIVERNWYVISIMFALAYKEHIKIQMIKDEYVEEYILANQFVKEHKIFLPYYYVLIWDIWKSGDNYKQKSYDYNQDRIKKILSILPEFYRDVVSGEAFYPTEERRETIATGMGENGKAIPIMTRLKTVDISKFLPSFVKNGNVFEGYNNGFNNEFFHPFPLMSVPCINIHVRLDVELFINGVYREIQCEELQKKLSNYQVPNLNEVNTAGNVLTSKISKEVEKNNELVIPNKDELLVKLQNKMLKPAELLLKYEGDRKTSEFLHDFLFAGFSRKPYDDLKKIYANNKSIPGKDTLIALSCSMHLTLEQAKELLLSCGYVFSPVLERDIVIQHMLENGIFDLKKINHVLEHLEFKPLRGNSGK